MNHPLAALSLEQLTGVFALTKTATAIHIGETAVIAFANDAMLRVWGKDKSVIGKSLEGALPELKGQPFIEMFARVWREGLTLSGEDTPAELLVNGRLQVYYFDFEYRAVLDRQGKTLCILHSATDVTDRVLGAQAIRHAREKSEALEREQALNEELAASAEELTVTIEELQESRDSLSALNNELEDRVARRTLALTESESRFRMMAENTDMLIATNDEHGGITYLNNAWLSFLGSDQQAILNFGWTNFIHLEDRDVTLNEFTQAFAAKRSYSLEFRMRHKSGEYRWLIARGAARFLDDGTFAGSVSSCMDITERKLDEIEKQTLNTVIDSSSEYIALAGTDFGMRYVNPAALRQLGWQTATGRNVLDAVYPQDRVLAGQILATLQDQDSISNEIRFYNEADGQPFWVEWNMFAIREKKEGKLIGLGMVNSDITQRKKHEQELQAINAALADSNEELAAVNEEMAATNEELELSHAELLLSEERFRSLIRQAPFGICVIRAHDLITTDVNDSYLELVGKSREELEHRHIWEGVAEASQVYAPIMQQVVETGIPFVANEHALLLIRNGEPESVFVDFIYEPVKDTEGTVSSIMVVGIDVTEKVLSRRKIEDVEERGRLAVEAGGVGTYDFNYITSKFSASEKFHQIYGFDQPASREQVLGTYIEADRHLSAAAHKAAALSGHIFYEGRINHPDQSVRWVRVQGNVYFNEQGQPQRVLGTVLDITDHKHMQQQKDDFISIASHELKTPITSLRASLQLLERMKDDPDPGILSFLINQSAKSMGKISELVDDLLNASRIAEGQLSLNKRQFVLATLLNECCNHVRLDGKHELIFEGDETLSVFADEQRIDQVIVNFVNNAVKYAPNSKKIFLIVEKLDGMAKVSVKDSGPGIPAHKIPHLFDRYFRAEESGVQASGLGLGLYISADIIARHKGGIGVESEEGKGSCFWFTLPFE